MSNNSIAGRDIGEYEPGTNLKEFTARPATIPGHFRSQPKLNWDATQSKLRHIWHTDRGNFYGPVIKSIDPNELSGDNFPMRQHSTYQVKFSTDFNVLGVTIIDFENQVVVQPQGMAYPIKIDTPELVSLQLQVPYYIRGSRKCKNL